jgi:4-aminobutyrate aminotransferase
MQKRMSYKDLVDQVHERLAPSFSQDWPLLPVSRAEGMYLYTIDDRRVLDFTSGIAVTNVGHNNPRVLAAIRSQMEKLTHGAVGVILHEPLLRLTEALPEVMPSGMEMFFFGNSGAEAVEGAIKLARYVSRRPVIIAFEGSFHGRTYGATSVTSVKSKYRLHYEPFVGGVYFAEYAYPYRCPAGSEPDAVTSWSLASLQKVFDRFAQPSEVAAILVEPVQGEGGYIVPPAEWLQALRRICDEHGILLIFDEVQSGFGRTGEMFAAQVFDVRPDIMAVAKGIANGVPLGATVASRELMSQWLAGSHGTTYGGNPLGCAAALATLEVIKEDRLLENCRAMGEIFLDGLEELKGRYPTIGDVRGLGLIIAMELVTSKEEAKPNPTVAMALLENCLSRGLLAYMAGSEGHVVRFMPPLIVNEDQIKEALNIIDESLTELST